MTANLERYVAALASDPGDRQAFGALEEAYFVAADWDKLVALYEQRLQDPGLQDAKERAPLHFRLGQILEERRLDIDLAIQQYTRAVQLDSSYGPALRQLRLVHSRREAWDLVLQIAELEVSTLREPYERAAFFAEMGDVWLQHLHDTEEALGCFQQALSIDPEHKEALSGLARTLQAQGNPEAAAATWERLIGCVRGPDRALPLVSLAHLLSGPLHQPERAVELYRRALGEDPRNEIAVEALSMAAAAKGQWELLADLFERRFSLAAGARRRTAIALEAGYVQLEQLGNVEAARLWFQRAEEMSGDGITILSAYVDLERESGDVDALAAALERLVKSARGDTPLRYLLEAAGVHTERADDEKALVCLEYAERQAPDDSLVLESLAATYANLQRQDELAAVLERRASLHAGEPETAATVLIELGYVQATQLGDIPAAQDAYERAFAADPARPGLATILESLYRKTESWEPLRALLERAAEMGAETERAGFLCSLGELLEDRFDDPAGSAARYEACLDLQPSPRALQGLSRLAARSGDPEAMRRALEREAAISTDPARLAVVCVDLSSRREQAGDLEGALAWAERMLDAQPESQDALQIVARLQETLGRQDALASTLVRLDEVLPAPQQAGVRRRIAELHESQGDVDAAVTWWKSTLEADADDRTALFALAGPGGHLERTGDWEELAKLLRRLADMAPVEERSLHLDRLSRVLDEQLCDLDGAIVVLWRLVDSPDGPAAARLRLENLLERAGRFEELAQQLLERRRRLSDDDPEAVRVDLRRANLMFDPLGQFEEAARAYRAVRLRAPESAEAIEGLERALRAANDHAGLARLLEERAGAASDPESRQALQLERATLLEDSLGELEQARQAYVALCDDPATGTETAQQAGARLDNLLERCGDWPALRARLEKAVDSADDETRIALHERVARLCEDRIGDAEGAVRHLEAAAGIDPSRPDPWRMLGALYQEQDRKDDLLRVTRAELETDPEPDRERVLHARAAALWTLRAGEEDRACEHYERLLELEPARVDATEFLVARYEAEGRFQDVVRLLEARLAAICAGEGGDLSFGLQTSLRLRIAQLRSEELHDPDGAIEELEVALDTDGPEGAAALPLADLYEATGRSDALVALCQQAADAARSGEDRVLWLVRLGEALRTAREDDRAIEVYREILAARPGDETATKALCELYRRGGHAEPLVGLLEEGLPRMDAREAAEVRIELARVLEEELGRPEDALTHLMAVIEADGGHATALHHALDLAHRQERYDREIVLIDARMEDSVPCDERAGLLERRADLLAGPLEAPEAAVAAYREVIALAPGRRSARASLRRVLEGLGRWTAVLDCLYVDAESADPQERAAIYEHAAEIATAQVGQDAALPWLERLRSVRPDDPLVIARIADVHRLAGRFESVLRALEDELEITRDEGHARDLHVGRARILERDMNAPGRAIAALEAARELAPDDAEVLAKLDQLYAATGRLRERAEVVEARLQGCAQDDRLPLHLAAAELYSGPLAEHERAIPHLLHAVALTEAHTGITGGDGPSSTPAARIALLADLAATLRAADRIEAWSRAAGSELAAIQRDLQDRPGPDDDLRVQRRNQLHRELAWVHADHLANPSAALHHLRALMTLAKETDLPGLDPEDREAIERRALDLLRKEANWIELEERLTTRVVRGAGDADEWLELARLRDERLHATSAARDAYAHSLDLRPDSLPAIRGLRDTAERLGDWAEHASALERERDLESGPTPARGALSRRLGEVAWRRLGDEDRARDAFQDALEVDADDLVALRALQQLHERRGEHGDAAALYEREASALGEQDPERRREAWLAAARLRESAGDDRSALDAFEKASELGTLAPELLRTRATLYERIGDATRYAAAFAEWCDAPDSGATVLDHLALVDRLVSQDRPDDALARCERALEADPVHPDAWARLATLHRDAGRDEQAADAWESAGEHRPGPDGAAHLCMAALLVEARDPECCARRLRRAVERDPASAPANAHLARVALALESFEEAETAATRALDLSGLSTAASDESDAALPSALARDAAIAGGRAARRRDRLESAVLFFGAALDLDPSNREALEAYGELLFERGDLAAARGALEARLEQGPDDRHAERLAMLGSVLELCGEKDAAMERFQAAVGADPACSTAHAGIARLCEKAERIGEAVRALEAWADASRARGDSRGAAARLQRAAELELARGEHASARDHLHASLTAWKDNPRGWVLLVELEAEAERGDDVLRHVPEAMAVERVAQLPDAAARLSLLYARALEQRGDAEAASEAYAEALRNDVRCSEAALSRARLLRAAGQWSEAADCLRAFAEEHPEPDHRDLAEVHYKLARLLAGPLEDMDAAILCFERALEIAPDHARAREPLASMLALLPSRWEQAVSQHVALLREDPTRAASLRALVGIARERGNEPATRTGLAILRATGAASPAERAEAPDHLPGAIVDTMELEGRVEEAARRLVQHAAEAIEQTLGTRDAADPTGSFSARRDQALRELAAPGLEALSDDALGDLLVTLASLALGDDADAPTTDGALDPSLAAALERNLGRWTRRKMRRLLDHTTLEEIRDLDPGRWRTALRGLAAAVAVDLGHGDLRDALRALCGEEAGESADLSVSITASSEAAELLRRVAARWCHELLRPPSD